MGSLEQEGELLLHTEAVSVLLVQKLWELLVQLWLGKAQQAGYRTIFPFLPKPLTVGLWPVHSSSLDACAAVKQVSCACEQMQKHFHVEGTEKSLFQRFQTQTLRSTSPENTVLLLETSLRLRVYTKRTAPLLSSLNPNRLQGTLSLPYKPLPL